MKSILQGTPYDDRAEIQVACDTALRSRAGPGRRITALYSDGRLLCARSHEMGGGRTRIHNPHGARLIVVRQSE